MTESICRDDRFSTTRLLTTQKPAIEKKSGDTYETQLFLPANPQRQGEGGLRKQGLFKALYPDKPLISVVTVVYNSVQTLEQTILSVLNQTYDNIEYIIIDGGSTDGATDILKKYGEKIDYWVSEPDKGIYDAINKGICLAQGDLVGIIHADDYYEEGGMEMIADTYARTKADVVYGDMAYCSAQTCIDIPAHSIGLKYGIFPRSFKWLWVQMLFGHPSSFVSGQAYKRYGRYDTAFKIAADYDFFLRIYRQGARFEYVRMRISNFREGGISTTDLERLHEENRCVRQKNSFLLAWGVDLLLYIMNMLRSNSKKGEK